MHKVLTQILLVSALASYIYLNFINPNLFPSTPPAYCPVGAICSPTANPLNWEIPAGVGITGTLVYLFGGKIEGET